MIDPHDTPGFSAALAAVEALGVLNNPESRSRLVVLVLYVAGPHIRAEALADMADEADDIAELWRTLDPENGADGALALSQFALSLDQASAQIREALS